MIIRGFIKYSVFLSEIVVWNYWFMVSTIHFRLLKVIGPFEFSFALGYEFSHPDVTVE